MTLTLWSFRIIPNPVQDSSPPSAYVNSMGRFLGRGEGSEAGKYENTNKLERFQDLMLDGGIHRLAPG